MEQHEIEQAEKHIRSAWKIGIISTVVTVVMSLVGAYNDDFRYSYGFDTWTLFDAALIAALTYGIYKKNRFCALGLLVYFVLSKFIAAAAEGQFPVGLSMLFFGYFYLMGTISAFKLHKHYKQLAALEGAPQKRSVVLYASAGIGILIVSFFVYLMVVASMGPGTEVLPGKQLKAEYVNFARTEGLLESGEQIQYWYSDAFSDFTDGFYFFTDQKVVIYNKTWEEPALLLPFATIQDIDFMHEPSSFEDSQVMLELNDGTYVDFPLSSDNGGDQRFYTRLNKLWGDARASVSTEAPATEEE